MFVDRKSIEAEQGERRKRDTAYVLQPFETLTQQEIVPQSDNSMDEGAAVFREGRRQETRTHVASVTK